MKSVDEYLTRQHDMKDYNCWDFIREVWLDLTSKDIGHRTPASGSRKEMKERFQREEQEFTRLSEKKDPCIVLMLRSNMLPHVGIYVRGRVLHLPERSYARFEPLAQATLGFKEVRFYDA